MLYLDLTMAKMQTGRLNMLCGAAIRAVASDNFFYGAVLTIVVLQALWYALSFQPTIFDEGSHLGNILIYSHHLSPFLTRQDPSWDHLGEVIRESSYLFYYIMGWPLRLIRLFTQDTTAQIIGLRVLCTAFFVGGLVLYRKALLSIARVPKSVVNLVFLFFILIPTVALLAGAVNYDNLVFLLFSAILFLAIRIIQSREVNILPLAVVVTLGLLMSVVKWASVALFVPVVLYLAYDLLERHRGKTLAVLWTSFRKAPRVPMVMVLVGLVISVGLFVERPIMNVIKYGNPEPACQKILSQSRCMENPTYSIYAQIAANKAARSAEFHPENPVRYLQVFWVPRMVDTADNLLEEGKSTELPIIKLVYDLLALIGTVVLLINLKTILKDKTHRLLFTILVVYSLFLVLDEYQGYTTYGIHVATRARYLVPVLPIFMYFAAFSIVRLFGKYKKSLVVGSAVLLLLCTQGGSIVTYSLTTPQRLYWQNKKVEVLNSDLRGFLNPLVKN